MVGSRIVEVEKDGHEDVENVAGFQDVVEEFLVKVAHLPEEDEQLLVILHLLVRVGQVRLDQGILEEPGEAVEHKGEILLAMDARQVVDEQVLVDHSALLVGRIQLGTLSRGVPVERDDKQLKGCLDQGLTTVSEEQMVVGKAEAHRIVGADHVQQRGEKRQSMAVLWRGKMLNPSIGSLTFIF